MATSEAVPVPSSNVSFSPSSSAATVSGGGGQLASAPAVARPGPQEVTLPSASSSPAAAASSLSASRPSTVLSSTMAATATSTSLPSTLGSSRPANMMMASPISLPPRGTVASVAAPSTVRVGTGVSAAPFTNVVNASTMCQQPRCSTNLCTPTTTNNTATPQQQPPSNAPLVKTTMTSRPVSMAAPPAPTPSAATAPPPSSSGVPAPAAQAAAASADASAPASLSTSSSATASTMSQQSEAGAIKQLMDAIESERLRKKQLEWYLQEVINEKQELILAHQLKLQNATKGLGAMKSMGVSTPGLYGVQNTSGYMTSDAGGKAHNVQHVLDGVDNYMFTKKRRMSVTATSGSLGEALQPPLKKPSISLDDASIASFLSFQDDDLQSFMTAPSVPPELMSTPSSSQLSDSGDSQSESSSASSSASASPASSYSAEEITVPPLLNSTSLTPRRPSISITPSGSLSLQSSSGSFSLSLPGIGIPFSGGKGSLSSYSFSADPMALSAWAYPQSDTTPSQAGGGRASFLQFDPRISFDWNLWNNEDHLKAEALTEFLDF